ncbi:MAG: hypothetical protein V5A23_00690 [Halobacteriales archaeon]
MFEYLAEVGELLAALVFTAAGAFAELTAAGSLADGRMAVGLWLAYVGAVALYAGLFVAGGGVLGRLFGASAGDA